MGDKQGKARKPRYTAIFLNAASTRRLLSAFPPPAGATPYAHHMTLKYKPSPEDMAETPIGAEATVVVLSVAVDDRACAVEVSYRVGFGDRAECQNDVPHVTIWTAPGTAPAYSNNMLSDARTPRGHANLVLGGTVGWFDGVHAVVEPAAD